MNARFRAGFGTALDHLPCLRRFVPYTPGYPYSNPSVTGIALTGNAVYVTYGLFRTFEFVTFI